MLYSSSLALIMMLEVEPKERLMRGGAVMMRDVRQRKAVALLARGQNHGRVAKSLRRGWASASRLALQASHLVHVSLAWIVASLPGSEDTATAAA